MVKFAIEMDSDAQQFCVLIDRSNPAPSPSLQQSIVAIEVEALLLVPISRSGGSLVPLRSREFILARQDKRANRHIPRHGFALLGSAIDLLFQDVQLTRLFTPAKGIPRLEHGAAYVDMQLLAACDGPFHELVKNHSQVIADIIDQP